MRPLRSSRPLRRSCGELFGEERRGALAFFVFPAVAALLHAPACGWRCHDRTVGTVALMWTPCNRPGGNKQEGQRQQSARQKKGQARDGVRNSRYIFTRLSPPLPTAAAAATPPQSVSSAPPPHPTPAPAGDDGLAGALADPKVVALMQRVAEGGVTPHDAAKAMREMSAGYQQVMDFAGE